MSAPPRGPGSVAPEPSEIAEAPPGSPSNVPATREAGAISVDPRDEPGRMGT